MLWATQPNLIREVDLPIRRGWWVWEELAWKSRVLRNDSITDLIDV